VVVPYQGDKTPSVVRGPVILHDRESAPTPTRLKRKGKEPRRGGGRIVGS